MVAWAERKNYPWITVLNPLLLQKCRGGEAGDLTLAEHVLLALKRGVESRKAVCHA